ncbi:MAG: metalloregulator ArsR/SmtB family transcription factor [Myxococcota bacterium]
MDLHHHLALLAEPTRVRLLFLLADEELAVGELVQVLQLPQSTVSRHLKALKDASWIRRRAEGSAGWFRMQDPLEADARDLWAVVQPRHRATTQASEDLERRAAVLEARRVDSTTFFGRMHAQWDALRTELFGESFIIPALLGLMPDLQTVVELGCGTGPNLVALAPTAQRIIGVDREARMLDAARERTKAHANIELRQGGLEDLPLQTGEAQLALCILVLHHVPDLRAAFSEMNRVVAPGGRVAITDMRRHSRTAYRDTMGHAHLGFDADTLVSELPAGLELHRWTDLPADPASQGPGLFTAVLARR